MTVEAQKATYIGHGGLQAASAHFLSLAFQHLEDTCPTLKLHRASEADILEFDGDWFAQLPRTHSLATMSVMTDIETVNGQKGMSASTADMVVYGDLTGLSAEGPKNPEELKGSGTVPGEGAAE